MRDWTNPVPRACRVSGRGALQGPQAALLQGAGAKAPANRLLAAVAASRCSRRRRTPPRAATCRQPGRSGSTSATARCRSGRTSSRSPASSRPPRTSSCPPKLRAAGAKTVYWDMHLNTRVGTPQKPADPAGVADQADRLFLRAVASSGCATPGDRARTSCSARGRPRPGPSRTRRTARTCSRCSAGSRRSAPARTCSSTARRTRPATRRSGGATRRSRPTSCARSTSPGRRSTTRARCSAAGRCVSRCGTRWTVHRDRRSRRRGSGFMLGFHTTQGIGSGREGLQPSSAWFDVVKLEALAAKQVAAELSVATVWSWGWGVWSVGRGRPGQGGCGLRLAVVARPGALRRRRSSPARTSTRPRLKGASPQACSARSARTPSRGTQLAAAHAAHRRSRTPR